MATLSVSYKAVRRVAGLAICSVVLGLPGCVGIFGWKVPGMVDLVAYEFNQIGLTMLLPKEKPKLWEYPRGCSAHLSPLHRYPRSSEEYRAFIVIDKVQKTEFERANRIPDPLGKWEVSFHSTLDEHEDNGVLILRKDVPCPNSNLVLSVTARTYPAVVSADEIAALRKMVDSVQAMVVPADGAPKQ